MRNISKAHSSRLTTSKNLASRTENSVNAMSPTARVQIRSIPLDIKIACAKLFILN
jgi:hypothetical protein